VKFIQMFASAISEPLVSAWLAKLDIAPFLFFSVGPGCDKADSGSLYSNQGTIGLVGIVEGL